MHEHATAAAAAAVAADDDDDDDDDVHFYKENVHSKWWSMRLMRVYKGTKLIKKKHINSTEAGREEQQNKQKYRIIFDWRSVRTLEEKMRLQSVAQNTTLYLHSSQTLEGSSTAWGGNMF